MTRAGRAYEQPTWAHRTAGSGYSSLLGTPNAHPRTHTPRDVHHGIQLANQIKTLPTPSAADSLGGHLSRGGDRSDELLLAGVLLPTPMTSDQRNGRTVDRSKGFQLRDVFNPKTTDLPGPWALLPTPAVNDMGAGKTPEQWDEWTARMQAKHGNGNGHGPSLAIEAARLLPTPMANMNGPSQREIDEGNPKRRLETAIDLLPTPRATRGGSATETVQLLPTPRAQLGEERNQTIWHRPTSEPQNLENALAPITPDARSRGVSTPPPSPDGSEPLDGQPPLPPNPDATDPD